MASVDPSQINGNSSNSCAKGNITFSTGGNYEFLRLEPDGRAFVRGKEVKGDQKVYDAFSKWMKLTGII